MSVQNEHPHLLLWYVSGDLGAGERAEIDIHLTRCEGCRTEAKSLASMFRSVRSQSRIDHVDASDLVRYEEGSPSLRAGRGAAISKHLAECDSCKEDLSRLALARRLETSGLALLPASPATDRRRGAVHTRRWSLAAAAAALLVAVSMLMLMRQNGVELGPPKAEAVVFSAPRRGVETSRLSLRGSGPWAIRVVLPFDAQEGRYRVTIRAEQGSPSAGFEDTASTDEDLCLSLLLPGLPGAGRYEMVLRPETSGAEAAYVYPFDLAPPAALRPAL